MYPTTQKQFTCIDINQTMNEICQYINSSSSIQYYQSMIKNVCELNELGGCRQLKNTILSFVITY